jgi:putative hydrolase of the HAD superfamily
MKEGNFKIIKNLIITGMNIKGIIFDFGFTLFYFSNPSTEAYFDCFNRGLRKSIELLKQAKILQNDTIGEKFFRIFNKKRFEFFSQSIKTKTEIPTSIIFQDVLRLLIEKKIIDKVAEIPENFFIELADLYHSCELDEWIPFENTEETLKKLSNLHSLKLAVLSNHPHHSIIKKILSKYDLDKYFDAIVTSAKFGKRKPAPEIFHYTLEKMGLTLNDATSCIMCGDEYADISGAYRAGLKTIIVERGYKFPFEKEVDLQKLIKIKNISEILTYIPQS